MAAYIVIDIEVHDAETYEAYKKLGPPTVEAYGGRYVARGGRSETLEGTWAPTRLVILEFPDADRARAWWASSEYAAARALRQESATSQMVLVEGL